MPPRSAKPAVASTRICFVRHATTPTTGKVLPGRAKGLHLSERGLAEAEKAGERLVGLGPVAALYCSPLERARETATAIGRRLGLDAVVERGLVECDFGEWTGAELAELRKKPEWQAVQLHPSGFRFPGGESFVEVQARMAGVTEQLCARHRGGTVVAVSHADPIKIAVGDALGVPLDLVQRTVVSPASVSLVLYGPAGPTVLAVNSTGDLGAFAPPALNGQRRRRAQEPA
ncbi:MAG TPA: histidine phosphatase family protein [Acidimicrobiales bacterium]|nr:histidine phosphatase family protein [Acidimicrobiales bacterium]